MQLRLKSTSRTKEAKKKMSPTRIQRLYAEIDSSYDAGSLGSATYQFAADVIQLLDPDEQDFDVVAHAKELQGMSIEELTEFRREDLEEWERDEPGVLSRRFEVGDGLSFSSLSQLIQCTDFSYIKEDLLAMYLGEKPIP